MTLTAGCDGFCRVKVVDVTTVQNSTGRAMTLSVCKGRIYGEFQAAITDDSTPTEVGLGSHQEGIVLGGMDAAKSCPADKGKTAMDISLSPASFGQVKLCNDQVAHSYVIVETTQTCPTGTVEQTSTAPCGREGL